MKTRRIGSLEWQENPGPELTWEDAMAFAAAQGDGWRLPTIHELFGLVDVTHTAPACSVFPETPTRYFWSGSGAVRKWSSPYTATYTQTDTKYAWAIDFTDGSAVFQEKGLRFRVRLVRDVSIAG